MVRINTNIAVPEELAKEIDKFIKKLNLGYRSRTEFAIEAIREKNQRLNQNKRTLTKK